MAEVDPHLEDDLRAPSMASGMIDGAFGIPYHDVDPSMNLDDEEARLSALNAVIIGGRWLAERAEMKT